MVVRTDKMTYFIGIPDQPATKSLDDLDEAIDTCKRWRSMYAQSDYRVTDANGSLLFPKHIVKTEYTTFFGVTARIETYLEEITIDPARPPD